MATATKTAVVLDVTVNKDDLEMALSGCIGAVDKKAVMPILTTALLEASGDQLTIACTDLEQGIRISCPAVVAVPGRGTVLTRKLLDWVRLLPEDEEVRVSFDDKCAGVFQCGEITARVMGMSHESFPELPVMPSTHVELPAEVLRAAINRTIFSISVEESRFTLNGALLVVGPAGLTMVSTDSHRIALSVSPLVSPPVESETRKLVPRKCLSEVLKLIDGSAVDSVRFGVDDSHLFFTVDDGSLTSRKLTGNFPDWTRVLKNDYKQTAVISRREFLHALQRSMQFADERSRCIRLTFSTDYLSVTGLLSDTGESTERIRIQYEGPTVGIGFNGNYLIEFLRAVDSVEFIQFQFTDPQTGAELRPIGAAGEYRYTVMPMRI